ncbi:MAG TPA: UvrD-helicase domain-containing protein [Thermoanaerobaculales bacterium]|nr:UvrD-helicase domain-containing protein [Thermoanaerobaculales bacterium]
MTRERSRLLELDQEARELAHTEFSRPLIIEAGAGTGKTALLTARAVAWCVGPGWELHAADGVEGAAVARRVIERVVAITFTDAAAAEMAQRVGQALAALARGESAVGVDRGLLAVDGEVELLARCTALADEVHRLPASTFHSWCHRQLRRFPLEAGLHPMFEVDADGTLVEAAAVEVVEGALRGLAEDPLAGDWQRLAAAGVVPPRIAEALERLAAAGVAPEALDRDPFAPDSVAPLLDRLRDSLVAFRQAEQGRLAAVSRNPTAAATREWLERLLELLDRRDGPDSLAELLTRPEPAVLARCRDWARGKFGATESAALGDAAPAVAAAAASLSGLLASLAAVREEELGAARRVLGDLLGRLRSRLRRSGVATYEDLLVSTERLLASSPRLRAAVRRDIDQLMVDEFQDTDDTQCRIVRWLALDGDRSRRPGLFIVGDPKQSIYGWRRADLAAYDAFTSEVADHGGLVRPLVRNFRSVRPILDEVERVVERVMRPQIGVQPSFQPLEATDRRRRDPGFADGAWSAVEHWLAWPADPDSGEIAPAASTGEVNLLEARSLAADIRRLHDEAGVPWGAIAVLLRATTAQEVVLDSFREAGVPFEVAREREYYRQREVVEAAALVRCVLEPGDALALLTVLRSDAVGVPDAALVPLWESGLPAVVAGLHAPDTASLAAVDGCVARAVAGTPADLPGADELPRWPVAVRAAAETVAVLRAAVRRDPPDRFVERLRTLWLTEVTASARYLGRFRRSRIERFLAELETALVSPDGSLSSVARFLRRAVEQGRESQLPAEPDVAADAVHVMTIHAAKGLDFDHVYLVQLHRGTGGGRGDAEAELQPSPDGLQYRLFGWPTPGFGEAEALRAAQSRAEQVRLLYVAMTRAKRRLVLSGRWRADGALVPAQQAKTFADLVSHRLDPAAAGEQVQERRRARREAGRPVQWLLLGGGETDSIGAPASERTRVFDLAGAATEAAALAAQRDAAAARAALRATAPVTSVTGGDALFDALQADGDSGPVRESALAVGSAVHRILESLDLEKDLPAQLRDAGERAAETLAGAVGPAILAETRSRLQFLLAVIEGGGCLRRLRELGDRVLARELPLLLPPAPGDPVVGALIGSADLVYAEGGRLVVVDFKTDELDSPEEVAARSAHHRPQLERYAAALQSALALDEPPAMELWFLAADRIIRL